MLSHPPWPTQTPTSGTLPLPSPSHLLAAISTLKGNEKYTWTSQGCWVSLSLPSMASRMQTLRPTPDLLRQDLHFGQMHGSFWGHMDVWEGLGWVTLPTLELPVGLRHVNDCTTAGRPKCNSRKKGKLKKNRTERKWREKEGRMEGRKGCGKGERKESWREKFIWI